MTIIHCRHELCGEDQHDAATLEAAHHHRVVSDEHDDHRVVAHWTGEDVATGRVDLTHHDVTVSMSAREAEFWARTMVGNGDVWLPAHGGGTAAVAIDLATAAEAILLLDGDIEPPEFGSRYVTRAVAETIGGYFEDEDEDELEESRA